MDRRSFIKLTAVSGTTAALAGCGDPDVQFIRFVPDEDIIPGQAVIRPSVCPLCAAGCGLSVRVMGADAEVVRDGRTGVVQVMAAKKLEGSASHPVNRGGLCARGQAAIQVTYHPDRITQPLKRTGNRGEGRFEAISWDDALAEVVGRLNELQDGGMPGARGCLAPPVIAQRGGVWGASRGRVCSSRRAPAAHPKPRRRGGGPSPRPAPRTATGACGRGSRSWTSRPGSR